MVKNNNKRLDRDKTRLQLFFGGMLKGFSVLYICVHQFFDRKQDLSTL